MKGAMCHGELRQRGEREGLEREREREKAEERRRRMKSANSKPGCVSTVPIKDRAKGGRWKERNSPHGTEI